MALYCCSLTERFFKYMGLYRISFFGYVSMSFLITGRFLRKLQSFQNHFNLNVLAILETINIGYANMREL